MKRDIYIKLSSWKHSKHRNPLIITGARRVGKTHILREFGRYYYTNTAYFNFETDPTLNSIFLNHQEPGQLFDVLSTRSNTTILPFKTLVIFDEIQNAPAALDSLSFSNEDTDQYHVAATSSFPGIKIAQTSTFQNGTIDFLNLFPLTFREYLNVVGKSRLRHILEDKKDFTPLPTRIHEQLIFHLKTYCFVGGMPEAVNQYVIDRDLMKVRQIHLSILESYTQDISTYSTPAQAARIKGIWNAVIDFLSEKNKKFKISVLSRNARTRDYKDAVHWLIDEGLVYRCDHIRKPGIPINRYIEDNNYKLYLLDTGLLATLLGLSPGIIDQGDNIFSGFNYAIAENFTAQELLTDSLSAENHLNELFFWTNCHKTDVPFILQKGEDFYPIDVRYGKVKEKTGLKIYSEKYSTPMLSLATPMNFEHEGNLFNYPLYSLSSFPIPIKEPSRKF